MEKKCKTCIYYESFLPALQRGNCHRFPKTEDKYTTDSCGEHKEKEPSKSPLENVKWQNP